MSAGLGRIPWWQMGPDGEDTQRPGGYYDRYFSGPDRDVRETSPNFPEAWPGEGPFPDARETFEPAASPAPADLRAAKGAIILAVAAVAGYYAAELM